MTYGLFSKSEQEEQAKDDERMKEIPNSQL